MPRLLSDAAPDARVHRAIAHNVVPVITRERRREYVRQRGVRFQVRIIDRTEQPLRDEVVEFSMEEAQHKRSIGVLLR